MLEALLKLYEEINFQDVIEDIKHAHLTENTCRNGRTVLWYMDERLSVAIYIDTLEFLSEEEIEEELC